MEQAIKKAIGQWGIIKGFEHIYEVSDYGHVLRISTARFLKPQSNAKGYLRYFLYAGKNKKRITAHRLVAQAFIPNPSKLPCINHKNGRKNDNTVQNLEWCTVNENNAHAKKNDLYKPKKGIEHGLSKLTESEVKNIRNLYRDTQLTHKEIARTYKVAISTIQRIIKNKAWKTL